MKVKFNKSTAMTVYHDRPSWRDGDVREVTKEIAISLFNHPEFTPADKESASLLKRLQADVERTGSRVETPADEKEPPVPKPEGDPSSSEASNSNEDADDNDFGIPEGLELSIDERAAYTRAIKKIDDGKSLDDMTTFERTTFEKVETFRKEIADDDQPDTDDELGT